MREIPEAPWHCSRRHPPLSLYLMRTRLLVAARRLPLRRNACWVWYGPLLLLLLLLLLLVHLACALLLLLLLLTCAPLLRCTSRCRACRPSPRSIRCAASRCSTQLLRLLCLLRAAGGSSRLLDRLLLPQLLFVARVICALEPKVFVLLLAVASQLLLCDACGSGGAIRGSSLWSATNRGAAAGQHKAALAQLASTADVATPVAA